MKQDISYIVSVSIDKIPLEEVWIIRTALEISRTVGPIILTSATLD